MKTITEDKLQLEIERNNRDERDISDEKYASKVVEKGMIWFIGIIATGTIGYVGSAIGKIITKL